MKYLWLFISVLMGLAGAAHAFTLPPGLTLTEDHSGPGQYRFVMGPLADGAVPRAVQTGVVTQQVWAGTLDQRSTADWADIIEASLAQSDHQLVFSCIAWGCGGFEFRFALDLLPAPAMHVDLGDFHYLVAKKPVEDGVEWLSVLISRSAVQRMIFVARVTPRDAATVQPVVSSISAPQTSGSVIAALTEQGHAVLSDLTFGAGAAGLATGDFASLTELAEYLSENPGARIALVGHTDTVGTLSGNMALSRKRAEAVRKHLLETYGVASDRVEAHGMGYLAPLSSNQTASGRNQNRRVEAVLLATP